MKKHEFPVMPDAIDLILAGLACLIMFVIWFGPPGLILPVLFIIFVLYFFRNPKRVYTGSREEIISPADGVIQFVEEVAEERYLHAPAIKVSIFLSVFDVHINRAPLDGAVEYLEYVKGKFLPAFKGHASELNERNYLGLRSIHDARHTVLVAQITGFIARRIVCWTKTGEVLSRGERFGMIKFGSCVEIYLPKGTEILVHSGQKVRGGETVIGRFKYE
ncbi:MAG: phosphatidylserine decarboxylase family protein [Clostridia bacterium]|nr:phosphatidylserine decarboxylase family protein [Clostridia bacterium]